MISKYLAVGVDKVAWWLQAQRSVVSMAPAVFSVVSECVSSAQADKQTQLGANTSMDAHTNSQDGDAHTDCADSENLLKRGLDCAAAWFKLGVLFTVPGNKYEYALPSACFLIQSSVDSDTNEQSVEHQVFRSCGDSHSLPTL